MRTTITLRFGGDFYPYIGGQENDQPIVFYFFRRAKIGYRGLITSSHLESHADWLGAVLTLTGIFYHVF